MRRESGPQATQFVQQEKGDGEFMDDISNEGHETKLRARNTYTN